MLKWRLLASRRHKRAPKDAAAMGWPRSLPAAPMAAAPPCRQDGTLCPGSGLRASRPRRRERPRGDGRQREGGERRRGKHGSIARPGKRFPVVIGVVR